MWKVLACISERRPHDQEALVGCGSESPLLRDQAFIIPPEGFDDLQEEPGSGESGSNGRPRASGKEAWSAHYSSPCFAKHGYRMRTLRVRTSAAAVSIRPHSYRGLRGYLCTGSSTAAGARLAPGIGTPL